MVHTKYKILVCKRRPIPNWMLIWSKYFAPATHETINGRAIPHRLWFSIHIVLIIPLILPFILYLSIPYPYRPMKFQVIDDHKTIAIGIPEAGGKIKIFTTTGIRSLHGLANGYVECGPFSYLGGFGTEDPNYPSDIQRYDHHWDKERTETIIKRPYDWSFYERLIPEIKCSFELSIPRGFSERLYGQTIPITIRGNLVALPETSPGSRTFYDTEIDIDREILLVIPEERGWFVPIDAILSYNSDSYTGYDFIILLITGYYLFIGYLIHNILVYILSYSEKSGVLTSR